MDQLGFRYRTNFRCEKGPIYILRKVRPILSRLGFARTTDLHLARKIPASVARQNSRGDNAARKKSVRASAVENLSTALRGPSAAEAWWLFLPTFFFFYYTILTSTERGASPVEN